MFINITTAAKEYFNNIISQQAIASVAKTINLRIKALRPGAYNASVELSYCNLGEHDPSDLILECETFVLYVEKNSVYFLTQAIIDYKLDPKTNSYKLHINAPFLKEKSDQITNNSGSEDLTVKIKEFLRQTVNPNLARHNGSVNLVYVKELVKENADLESDKILEIGLIFDGGCKGCSMIDLTLKLGVEKALKQEFNQIFAIKDLTDHADGKMPFYSL